jgi:hypothetical protein
VEGLDPALPHLWYARLHAKDAASFTTALNNAGVAFTTEVAPPPVAAFILRASVQEMLKFYSECQLDVGVQPLRGTVSLSNG